MRTGWFVTDDGRGRSQALAAPRRASASNTALASARGHPVSSRTSHPANIDRLTECATRRRCR